MPKVFIVGGGVGGLSAAHELAQRPGLNLEVHLFESASHFGGKAASQAAHVDGVLAPGLGEHGFRFFPWFYRHLAETFAEIQLPGGTRVLDLLEESTHAGLALDGGVHHVPRKNLLLDFLQMTQTFVQGLGAPMTDMARYAGYLLKFHTSCHRRRAAVYEHQSWSEFSGMDDGEYTPGFAELLEAIPTMLVAMEASRGSARTLGNVGQQMMFDFDTASYAKVDAVLQGPTSKIWIEPWVAQLGSKGVQLHTGHRLTAIVLNGAKNRVQELHFQTGSGLKVIPVASDGFCVCAVPIEAMAGLLTPALVSADPALQALHGLVNASTPPWSDMIGVQYFLDTDLPMLKGHVAYPKTAWALTSVSQPQFWGAGSQVNADLAQEFGVTNLRGVVSVIASAWNTPVQDVASAVSGRSARDCTAQEIKDEVWRQLVAAAFPAGQPPPQPFAAHLDVHVRDVQNGGFANETPLLIHPPGSYPKRPGASLTNLQNLMLAADYVATHTELATMEGANEAGRRAVAAILTHLGVPQAQHPKVYELEEGVLFANARDLDCVLFDLGAGHLMDSVLGTNLLMGPALGDFEAFDVARFAALREDDLAVWFDPPRVPATSLPHIGEAEPALVVPDPRLAYAPFPPTLPPGVGEGPRKIYAAFQEQRPELEQFREHPTQAGYRQWERLLQSG